MKKKKLKQKEQYFQHEMLDRLHLTQTFFYDNIDEHPMNEYFKKDIEKISNLLWNLYQKVEVSKVTDKEIRKLLKQKKKDK